MHLLEATIRLLLLGLWFSSVVMPITSLERVSSPALPSLVDETSVKTDESNPPANHRIDPAHGGDPLLSSDLSSINQDGPLLLSPDDTGSEENEDEEADPPERNLGVGLSRTLILLKLIKLRAKREESDRFREQMESLGRFSSARFTGAEDFAMLADMEALGLLGREDGSEMGRRSFSSSRSPFRAPENFILNTPTTRSVPFVPIAFNGTPRLEGLSPQPIAYASTTPIDTRSVEASRPFLPGPVATVPTYILMPAAPTAGNVLLPPASFSPLPNFGYLSAGGVSPSTGVMYVPIY